MDDEKSVLRACLLVPRLSKKSSSSGRGAGSCVAGASLLAFLLVPWLFVAKMASISDLASAEQDVRSDDLTPMYLWASEELPFAPPAAWLLLLAAFS